MPGQRYAIPLNVVSQKPKDSFLGSLRASKYLYGAGLTTVANKASGKLGAVKVVSMPERCGKELVFEDKFSLAVVNGHQRRLYIQKLPSSGRPGTEWASQPI